MDLNSCVLPPPALDMDDLIEDVARLIADATIDSHVQDMVPNIRTCNITSERELVARRTGLIALHCTNRLFNRGIDGLTWSSLEVANPGHIQSLVSQISSRKIPHTSVGRRIDVCFGDPRVFIDLPLLLAQTPKVETITVRHNYPRNSGDHHIPTTPFPFPPIFVRSLPGATTNLVCLQFTSLHCGPILKDVYWLAIHLVQLTHFELVVTGYAPDIPTETGVSITLRHPTTVFFPNLKYLALGPRKGMSFIDWHFTEDLDEIINTLCYPQHAPLLTAIDLREHIIATPFLLKSRGPSVKELGLYADDDVVEMAQLAIDCPNLELLCITTHKDYEDTFIWTHPNVREVIIDNTSTNLVGDGELGGCRTALVSLLKTCLASNMESLSRITLRNHGVTDPEERVGLLQAVRDHAAAHRASCHLKVNPKVDVVWM